MENKCWICGRTEEQFKKDFLNQILADTEISEEMKEAAKSEECILALNSANDGYVSIVAGTKKDVSGIKEYEGAETVISVSGYAVPESLFIYICPICGGLLRAESNDAIHYIEDEYSALLNWYYKRGKE